MRPDEAALSNDLQSLAFRIGERRGKWKLKGVQFPFALFFIAARPLSGGPSGFLLRSECSGYPAIAPTSQLWHGGLNAALELRFRPHTAQGVMEAFKDWNHCLYHPIDRAARDHGKWAREFPELLWMPERNITFLLETVYDLLHRSEYVAAALPAEALNVPQTFVDIDFKRAS